MMQTMSAMRPYATVVLPPRAISPTVNIGMSTLARVPPMPAKRVAREANWFLALGSVERAGTMPQ